MWYNFHNIVKSKIEAQKQKKPYKKVVNHFYEFIEKVKKNSELVHITTSLAFLLLLLVSYYIINGFLFLAGLIMIFLSLALIVDDEIINEASGSKVRKYYASLLKIGSEIFLFFSLAIHFFTKNNYFSLILMLLMFMTVLFYNYFVASARSYKIKKIPENYFLNYRQLILIIGLLLDKLIVFFLGFYLFLLLVSIWQIFQQINSILILTDETGSKKAKNAKVKKQKTKPK